MGLFSIFRRATAEQADTRPETVETGASVVDRAVDPAGPADEIVRPPTITPPAWMLLPPLTATSHQPIARTFDADVGRRLRAQRSASELLATSALSHTVDPSSHGIVDGLVRVSAAEGMPAVRAGADGVLRRRVLRSAELAAADHAHPRWPILARAVDAGAVVVGTVARDADELAEPFADSAPVEEPPVVSDAAGALASAPLHRSADESAPARVLPPVDAPLAERPLLSRLSAGPTAPSFDAPVLGGARPSAPVGALAPSPVATAMRTAADPQPAAPVPPRRRSIVEMPSASAGHADASASPIARRADDGGARPDGDGALADDVADAAGAPGPAVAPAIARAADPGVASDAVPTLGRRPGLGAPLGALPPTALVHRIDDDPFAGWADDDEPPALAAAADASSDAGSGSAALLSRSADVGAWAEARAGSDGAAPSPASSAAAETPGPSASVELLRVVAADVVNPAHTVDADSQDADGHDAAGRASSVGGEEHRALAGARALGGSTAGSTALLARAVEVGPTVVRVERSIVGARDASGANERGVGGAVSVGRTSMSSAAGAPVRRSTTGAGDGASATTSATRATTSTTTATTTGSTATATSTGSTAPTTTMLRRAPASPSSAAPSATTAVLARLASPELHGVGASLPIASDLPSGEHASAGGVVALAPLRRLAADTAPDVSAGREHAGLALARLPNLPAATAANSDEPHAAAGTTTALLEREPDDAGPSTPDAAAGPGPVPGAPSGGTAAGASGAAGAAATTAHADTELDLLAGRLYDRIRYRLRRELLDDRERAGLVLDRVR